MNSQPSSLLPTELHGSQVPRIGTARDPQFRTRGNMVAATAELAGFTLDDWQRLIVDVAGELKDDSNDDWLHRLITYVVARQNGKTEVLKARILAGLFVFADRKIVHTAQDREIPRQLFLELVEHIEGTPAFSKRLHGRNGIRYSNGQEHIKLKDGSLYRIIAPRAQAIRGEKPPPDVVIIDEIREQRTGDLWAAAVPTGRTRRNFQLWTTSNAGSADSVVLNRLRDRGRLAAEDPATDRGIAYLEWSAREGRRIDDTDGWIEANPALGIRITGDTIREEIAAYGDDVDGFRTEILCQWVETSGPKAIPFEKWIQCGGAPELVEPGPPRPVIAFDVDGKRTHAAVAIAARRDGRLVVDVVQEWIAGAEEQVSINELAAGVLAWMKRYRIRDFAYDKFTGQTAAELLIAKGRKAVPVDSLGFVAAAGNLSDAVQTGFMLHRNNPSLNDQITRAVRSTRGDGLWFISRKESEGTISGVLASAFAVNLAYRPDRSPSIK